MSGRRLASTEDLWLTIEALAIMAQGEWGANESFTDTLLIYGDADEEHRAVFERVGAGLDWPDEPPPSNKINLKSLRLPPPPIGRSLG